MRPRVASREGGRWRAFVRPLPLLLAAAGCQQTVTFVQSTDGGDALSGVPPDVCTSDQKVMPLNYSPERPEVILAVDRSTSMMMTGFGATSELGAAIDALDTVVTKYYTLVNFDYVEFPGADFNCSQSSSCCASHVTPIPNPSSFQYQRCDSSGPGCPVSAEHPIGAALGACLSYYMQPGARGGRRYVLLVTDALPTCNGGGNGAGSCQGEKNLVGELRNYSSVETAVVVLGNVADDQCLTDLANAGGISNNGFPFYYAATTPDGLATTIDAVVAGKMASDACTLDLGGSPENPDQVVLLLNGTVVPRGDGWTYDDSSHTHITLSSSACQQFLASPAGLGLLGCSNTRH